MSLAVPLQEPDFLKADSAAIQIPVVRLWEVRAQAAHSAAAAGVVEADRAAVLLRPIHMALVSAVAAVAASTRTMLAVSAVPVAPECPAYF